MATRSIATPETSTAIEAFVRLVRANAAVTRQLSAQLSADHGVHDADSSGPDPAPNAP